MCFDIEDPRKYVKRLQYAIQQRIYADSMIRYSFILDCMPIEYLSDMEITSKKKICELVNNKKEPYNVIKLE